MLEALALALDGVVAGAAAVLEVAAVVAGGGVVPALVVAPVAPLLELLELLDVPEALVPGRPAGKSTLKPGTVEGEPLEPIFEVLIPAIVALDTERAHGSQQIFTRATAASRFGKRAGFRKD